MKNTLTHQSPVCVVAIVGGSGAGKTWLANRLIAQLGENASHLSLDDFYRDRSHLPPGRRIKLNFDSPNAIDWPAVTEALRHCREGKPVVNIPRYDFATHSRSVEKTSVSVRPVIIVEGLWLLHRPALRSLFDIKIFVECPRDLRFSRRMERDVLERGRTAGAVSEQFRKTVLPMHERHVEPQARWADEMICSPLSDKDVIRLTEKVKSKIASVNIKSLRCNMNN